MIIPFGDQTPIIPDSAFIAPSVDIIGDVTVGEEASLWFGTVARGDMHFIRIGRRSNIQDNCTIHVTTDLYPTIIGDEVTVGHKAIIHGCVINERCLIGMGAIIMDGVEIGSGSLIAAGAVVIPGTRVPPRSLYAGVPARLRRKVTDAEYNHNLDSAQHYVDYARRYRSDGHLSGP